MHSYDYIIVGGGSAGAAAAARLSETSDYSVLLIEAGGGGMAPFLQIPSGIFFAKGSPRYHWLQEIEPDQTRNGRRETLTNGRGLGGGSAINGMVFVKGLRQDYDAWEAAAGPEWNPDLVNSAFERVDAAIRPQPPSEMHPVADRFINAMKASGYPETSSNLLETGVGVMPCPASAADGWRRSTCVSYLRPARKRPNLTIRTNCLATRLLFDGLRVRGVEVMHCGRKQHLMAKQEVILCAGAINTPQLLMLSGVGPADHLRSVGIDPLLDRPELGENLQDHPCIWLAAEVRQKTWNDLFGPVGILKTGARWLWNRTGPAASGMCHVTLYGSTNGVSEPAEFQASFMPAGWEVLDLGVKFLGTSSFSVGVSLCKPSGRGSVRLRTSSIGDAPVIRYNLLSTQEDTERLAEACRIIRKVLDQPAMADTITRIVAPGADVKNNTDWLTFVRRSAVNMCHPAGSCRMGKDEDAIVDSRLRVRGLTGLRVADASIMPIITSGNTNAPAIMIGERVAEFIAAERG